ncbi:MAG: CvpA family protein [bacterium]|nr:CvpA family protein [bacterium]
MGDVQIPDIIVAGVLLFFFLRSIFRGAIKEFFSLLGLGGGYFTASRYGDIAGQFIIDRLDAGEWMYPLSRTVMFVLTWIILSLVGTMVSKLAKGTSIGFWNRMGGGVLGLAKGALLAAVAILVLDAYLPGFVPRDEKSRLVPYIRRGGVLISQMVGGDAKRKLEELKKKVGSAKDRLPEIPSSGKNDRPANQ